MEEIKKKILLLINQDFMKNHFGYKNDLENLNTIDELVLWINTHRHLFNIYFRQDLDKILVSLKDKSHSTYNC